MNRKKTVAVILPCYNEGKRALPVIKEVKKSDVVDEIVIVDDGSKKETKDVLKKISGVKVIYHPKNLGKSQAMKTGVLSVKSSVVVFLDTDLSGFKSVYLNDFVDLIVNEGFDLVLGDYERELKFFKMLGLSVVLTGQRAVKRDLLLKNMNVFEYGGYLAEVAMNRVFFKTDKVARIFLKGVGQKFKYQKNGITGFFNDLKFFKKVIKEIGIKELVKQTLFIRNIRRINYL